MTLAPIALILVLTLLGVIAFSFSGRNRVNMSDSIALAIIGVVVAILCFALIRQEGFAVNDLWRSPINAVETVRPDIKVWVDSETGLYYCNGSKQYGKGKRRHYMTQHQARSEYYKPALGEPCE